MSPARRLPSKNPDKRPETSRPPRKDQRVRLTEEVRQFLKISPFVLVPTLKTNCEKGKDVDKGKPKKKENKVKEKAKAYEKEKANENDKVKENSLKVKENKEQDPVFKQPLENGQLCRLPATKMSAVNGIAQRVEKLKQKDIRDDDSKKGTFLTALNLVDTSTAERIIQHSKDASLAPSLNQKLKSRKGQVVSFFKNNPVPISSKLGKQIVIKAGIGKCTSPKDEITRYEKYCSFFKQRNLNHTTNWPQVNVKKAKLSKDQYCHTYSYGKRQRITRNVELVVGCSTRSFSNLNECRDASVRVYRMTDRDIAKAMFRIHNGQSVPKAKKPNGLTSQPQLRWVASEPCAGPSRGIEIIAEPVVRLYDIRLSPSKADYFR